MRLSRIVIGIVLPALLLFAAACSGGSSNPTEVSTTTGEPVGTATGEPVGTATGEPVGTATGEPVGTATGEPVGTATGEPVGTATGEPVGTATGEPVSTATGEPVSTATGEPVSTATGEPVGSAMGVHDPCMHVDGSEVDPCEYGVVLPTVTGASGGLGSSDAGDAPASIRSFIDGVLGHVPHIVLRGTYLPDSVRCVADIPFLVPSYRSGSFLEGSNTFECYVDVRANSYLVGSGRPN